MIRYRFIYIPLYFLAHIDKGDRYLCHAYTQPHIKTEEDPSIKAAKSLVSDVTEAKQITEEFSLNPEIEDFLKKVSSQRATVNDLTPNVLIWLKGKNLTGKLKIRF